MSRAVKRSHSKRRHGQAKALYLPMSRSAADDLVLPVRVAFESLRCGYGKRDAVVCLSEIVLLTSFLAEAGHSTFEEQALDDMEKHLLAALEAPDTHAISFDGNVMEKLMVIVNEYDRLLRESRLLAIVEANERLTKLTQSALAGGRRSAHA